MNIINTLRPLIAIVSVKRAMLMLLLMVLVGLTEGFGIILLVPLLQSLQADISTNAPNLLLQQLTRWGLPNSSSFFMAIVLVLIIVRTGLQYARERLSVTMQHQIVDSMRLRSFKLLLNTQWKWLTQQNQTDQANSLLVDINRIGVGFNFSLSLIASLVTLMAYLAVAFIISWKITLLAFISGSFIIWILSSQRKKALMLGQQLGEANRATQATVQQSLAGIKLAKILGKEDSFIHRFNKTISGLRKQQISFQRDTSLSKALFQIFGATLLITYLLVGINVLNIEVAKLLTLVIVFSRMIPLFMSAQQQLHHCLHALPALNEAQQLQQLYLTNAEPTSIVDAERINIESKITLENINFQYLENEKPTLKNISFTINAHTTTAVIGHSGAGKSTLADILMGLLPVDSGRLLLDDEQLTPNILRQWRNSVAYVPQDVFLFNDTIANNLRWGDENATDEALKHVLTLAAAEFVYQLPLQLNTIVGDGGVRLSGGERQRIVLARALLKQPSLLILDEATSALDMENEHRIRQAIENLHGNVTVVLIGHRLATLEHADQVIKIANGKVVAQGSWQQITTNIQPTESL